MPRSGMAHLIRLQSVAALEELLSDQYIHVNGGSGSVLDRRSWLDWVSRRRQDIEVGRFVVEMYEVRDLNVRVHGEAAVVVGVVASRERRSGAVTEQRVRFTNVWVREAGRW